MATPKSRIIEDSYHSGMKFWLTFPGEKHQLAEVLVEGGGNVEWVVEEKVVDVNFGFMTDDRNEGHSSLVCYVYKFISRC